MQTRSTSIGVLAAALLVLATAVPASGASTVKTKGTATSVDISWTEYDPDDLLRLPGNVHVGYISVGNGPYGTYFWGTVTDFDCDEGETPWGGGGHGEDAVEEAADIVGDATEEAIEEMIDEGATFVDAVQVLDAIEGELATEIPELDEPIGACDYLQDRYLEGQDANGTPTVTITVDRANQIARVKGALVVTDGGHGGSGAVLGRPPIDMTITGGQWNKFESSYSMRGEGYRFSDYQKGISYYNGDVAGAIGAMGFADDADDESYAGFTWYKFETVEKFR